VRHPDSLKRVGDSLSPFGRSHSTVGQRELHVFKNGQITDQVKTLKDESDFLIANAGAFGGIEIGHRPGVELVGAGGRSIELVVDASSDEVIGPEVAVPLGLLVTEAITNAYKHAFAGRNTGRIEVILRRDPDGRFCAMVRDDGTGFRSQPMPPKDSEQTGLGQSLIEAFVRQLRGQLEIESNAGTIIKVRFPMDGTPAAKAPRAAQVA